MLLFDCREPVSAWSHGAGMLLALPVTWILWKRCTDSTSLPQEHCTAASRYEYGKALCLLVFGVSLIICYGISALFHATPPRGTFLSDLQRLDHVGIYVLIAGTYTPIAWSLMRGRWRWTTLIAVWTVALVCSMRVWCGGVMPMWVSTPSYLAMGWAALFCYAQLATNRSHRSLLPLPLGGIFYTVGAVFNLARWPVIFPGVIAAHELFHFFVIAGSACHIIFMLSVVVPSREPGALPRNASPRPIGTTSRFPQTLLRPPIFPTTSIWLTTLIDRQRSVS